MLSADGKRGERHLLVRASKKSACFYKRALLQIVKEKVAVVILLNTIATESVE